MIATHAVYGVLLSLLLSLSASIAQGQLEPLSGTVELVATDVPSFDPAIFAPAPNVDVFRVTITNPNDIAVTSLDLTFPGPWQNCQQGGLAFKDSPELPTLGPNTVAESFFVLPPGTSPLAVDTVDDATQLSSAYTVAGDTALVPAEGTATVATLSVLSGTFFSVDGFTASGAINGEFTPQPAFLLIDPRVPEPTSFSLLFAAAVAVACRRR